jgi:hypothetical protein
MRSISKLSVNERETLALLYDTPYWKVIRKLIDIERLELAKDSIERTEILEVRHLAGQAAGLKKLVGEIKANFKDVNKKG